MGEVQCQQLVDLGVFEECFQLLTGFSLTDKSESVDKSKQKKWTSSQSREFSDLFTLLAFLILSCDTSPHMSIAGEPLTSNQDKLLMPGPVSSLLYGDGSLAVIYISETLADFEADKDHAMDTNSDEVLQ